MARIYFTSAFDLPVRLIQWILNLILFWGCFSLVGGLVEQISDSLLLYWIVALVSAFGLLIGFNYCLLGPFCATVSALAYARISLHAPLNWWEARQASHLFAGDVKGHWQPLRETKELPRAERVGYINAVARNKHDEVTHYHKLIAQKRAASQAAQDDLEMQRHLDSVRDFNKRYST